MPLVLGGAAALAVGAAIVAWRSRSAEAAPEPAAATTVAAAAARPEGPAPATLAPQPARAAAPPPDRPQVVGVEDLLAAASLRGFARGPDGSLASEGPATLSAPYAPTPGHVLTVTVEQAEAPRALALAFTGADGRRRRLEVDRELGDGARGLRLDAAGEIVEAPGTLLQAGVEHVIELEVHPSAVVVLVDGHEVLRQGQPGAPPATRPQRVNGRFELVTEGPARVAAATFGKLGPPPGMRPQEAEPIEEEAWVPPVTPPRDDAGAAPPEPDPRGGGLPPPRDTSRPPPRAGGGPPPRR